MTCYTLPNGVVSYQNALFCKEGPHLVKHMRMDSDVQDVFERHHMADGVRPVARKKRKGRKRGKDKSLPNESVSAEKPEADSRSISLPPNVSKEDLLRSLMRLSVHFLKHPGTLPNDDGSLERILHLFRSHGARHLNGISDPDSSDSMCISAAPSPDVTCRQIQPSLLEHGPTPVSTTGGSSLIDSLVQNIATGRRQIPYQGFWSSQATSEALVEILKIVGQEGTP